MATLRNSECLIAGIEPLTEGILAVLLLQRKITLGDGPISNYDPYWRLAPTIDHMLGSTQGLMDQVPGELGPSGAIGMLDDVVEGQYDLAESVDDRIDRLPDLTSQGASAGL